VLALDVEDLDLLNRRANVRRKAGAVDWIIWQTGTARLMPRLLKGRKSALQQAAQEPLPVVPDAGCVSPPR
jgi:hypothetical protein